MSSLHWSRGGESGSVELSGELTFGRGDDVGLVLADPKLSRLHAAVEPDGKGDWRVVDRGSSNGLVRDGVRVGTLDLVDGARFQAGDTTFRFESGGGRAIDRTVLAEPLGVATVLAAPSAKADDPSAIPPRLEPDSPASSPRAMPPGIRMVAAVVLVVVAGAALWFFIGRSKGEEGGGKKPGLFASEEEKRVAALETESTSRDYAKRWRAYKRLKEMGRQPDPGPLWILDLETHPDDDVREAAAEKLGKARYVAAIPNLKRAEEKDSDWNVRSAAEDALEEMGVK